MVTGVSSRSSGIGLGRCPHSRSDSAPPPLSEDEGSSEEEEEEEEGQAGGGLATSGAERSKGLEAESVANKKKDTAVATAARRTLKALLRSPSCVSQGWTRTHWQHRC